MEFTQEQIIKMIFLSLTTPGIVITLIGIIIPLFSVYKAKKCTAVTTGRVFNYYHKGEMRIGPSIEFRDDENLPHRARKKFEGYKQKVRCPDGISDVYEDEKGWLHTSRGAIGGWRKCASEKWPVGSEMTVYYDPKYPETNYVERPIYHRVTAISFILTGILFIALSLLMYYVMIK